MNDKNQIDDMMDDIINNIIDDKNIPYAKNIIIMRHFKTFDDFFGNQKIIYDKSLIQSNLFVDFIINHLTTNKYINKIKIYTSNHERTIDTVNILISKLKSKIIKKKIKSIEIFDPIISNTIDRDPLKKKHINICQKIKNEIESKLKHDTLYIFTTHSSLIYNLFECFLNIYADKNKELINLKKIKKHIHSYSLSFISIKNDNLKYKFNINMK